MLRRYLSLILLGLVPAGAAWALPAAPASAGSYTIQAALVDKVEKTGTPATNAKQGLLGYTLTIHDDKYQYVLPLCKDAALVEVDGSSTNPDRYVSGNALVASVRPDTAAPSGSCVARVVRQQLSSGASGGECLQKYQVAHSIEGSPSPVITSKNYTFRLAVHSRPTLDCDSQTYGANPITTVAASQKPFIVTVSRVSGTANQQLMSWSLRTDSSGQASFNYSFDLPSDRYVFAVVPGLNATAGDVISWTQKVIQPHLPTELPVAVASDSVDLSLWPYAILLIITAFIIAFFDYRLRLKRAHEKETPEEEYQRIEKL